MRCVFCVLLLLAAGLVPVDAARATEWMRTYGHSEATAVHPAPDGGFILAGTLDRGAPTGRDAWIERIDPDGNPLWTKIFAGAGWDTLRAVRPTADGGVIAAGTTNSFTLVGGDAWILKLDGRGNIVWQRLFGDQNGVGESVSDIASTPDGGLVAVGTAGFRDGQYGWVLTLDGDGNLLWDRTYGGPGAWLLAHVDIAADGGIAVAGSMSPLGLTDIYDAWVMKLDGDGNVVWQKTYGGDSDDVALDVRSSGDGGFVVAGTSVVPGRGWMPWVLRLDARGAVVWDRVFDLASAQPSVQPAGDGGFVVAAGYANLWKLDADGAVVWRRSYGTGLLTGALRATADGGYVMAGITPSPGDAYVLKVDAEGAIPGCARMDSGLIGSAPWKRRSADSGAFTGTSGVAPRSSAFDAWEDVRQTRLQCLHVSPGSLLSAIEYYHAWFDHYFVTAAAAEMIVLDGGAFGAFGGWARTGEWFPVYAAGESGAPVCRFFSGQTYAPMSTHFYTSFADECEALKGDPRWVFEGVAFALAPPFLSVACREGTAPLYRLYNRGMSGVPNHRYTTSPAIRAAMIARGWVSEGPGAGIAGCVPVR